MTVCRGIRGATIAEENTADGIYSATKELLDGLIEGNSIIEREVAAVYFTMTPDLNAVFPGGGGPPSGMEQHSLDGRHGDRSPRELDQVYPDFDSSEYGQRAPRVG